MVWQLLRWLDSVGYECMHVTVRGLAAVGSPQLTGNLTYFPVYNSNNMERLLYILQQPIPSQYFFFQNAKIAFFLQVESNFLRNL